MRSARQTQELDINGWRVKLISSWIDEFYLAEVEAASSAATIAIAIGHRQEEAEREALEIATRRLLRARQFDLTVGG